MPPFREPTEVMSDSAGNTPDSQSYEYRVHYLGTFAEPIFQGSEWKCYTDNCINHLKFRSVLSKRRREFLILSSELSTLTNCTF